MGRRTFVLGWIHWSPDKITSGFHSQQQQQGGCGAKGPSPQRRCPSEGREMSDGVQVQSEAPRVFGVVCVCVHVCADGAGEGVRSRWGQAAEMCRGPEGSPPESPQYKRIICVT